ncbi:MAG TPA: hypothetical protein PKA00_16795 [Saprospiraceae bacterium]|nr:hypothetical protein [Saprospiraceae bacterium]HMQ84576.1 hypothetical protein [Saprospiraceae bacterium]
MKKIALLTSMLMLALTAAQSQVKFQSGDIEFSTGIGIFSTYAKDKAQMIVPPLSARIDVRLGNKFTLGAYAAYSAYERLQMDLPDGSIQDLSSKTTIIGLRAAAHHSPRENWDVYGGAMLGYNMPEVERTVTEEKILDEAGPSFSRPAENTFTYSAFLGAAYYPTETIGLFAEVGYGISILTTGISFKF